MGGCLSSETASKASITILQPEIFRSGKIRTYKLKKRKPGFSGMWWRSDPSGRTQLLTNTNWPRDGAIIKGEKYLISGEPWLRATQVMQVTTQKFEPAPEGAYLPFSYNDHYYLEEVIA